MRTAPLLVKAAAFVAFATGTASAALVVNVGQRASSDLPTFNRIATYATNGAGLTGHASSILSNECLAISRTSCAASRSSF